MTTSRWKNLILRVAVITMSCGLVFGQAQEKVLWSFAGPPGDGLIPIGNLILDPAGNLYGVTQAGGSSVTNEGGTVFELSPDGQGSWFETILYNFCSDYVNFQCLDGALPQAGLVLDSANNLYGTTWEGGANGQGTVFELSPPSAPGGPWTESVLHSFCANNVNNQCLDGAFPASQLALDAQGNLYGTAGGGSGHGSGGIVFEFSLIAGEWTETILYDFCSLGQGNFCPDGGDPRGGVAFDKSNNLFGTTQLGGAPSSVGGGTIYKLSANSEGWVETVLFASAYPSKGSDPQGGASLDGWGNLYTTFYSGGQSGNGGVFKLAPGGSHVEFWFDGADGSGPGAGVLVDLKRHALYGTTEGGGDHGGGTVFKMTAPAQEAVVYSFCQQTNCSDGGIPVAGLIEDNSGNLYGTAKGGGTYRDGVVFEITP
jgi:uncharacterized repeat protein (TIGR03803 family)